MSHCQMLLTGRTKYFRFNHNEQIDTVKFVKNLDRMMPKIIITKSNCVEDSLSAIKAVPAGSTLQSDCYDLWQQGAGKIDLANSSNRR